MKFFNTVGPINPEKHYYIPGRLNEKEIRALIEQEKYFILHAPRQSGKTTAIKEFVKQLNQGGIYKALYFNVEPAQTTRGNVKEGMESILTEIGASGELFLDKQDTLFNHVQKGLEQVTISSLKKLLQDWSSSSDKPIVLFIDEIDSLVGDTLISVLRQLRAGYMNRPKNFPQSACLVGVRDVRDYRIWSDKDQAIILGGSAFNIKAESLVLSDFTFEQIKNLYNQHTDATGQQFADEAIEYAFYLTQGQPWLVNALAYQACFKDVTDRTKIITKEIIERAKETLIVQQDTHLDVLIARLNEQRVYAVIDAIISGASENPQFTDDDVKYVVDLGLVKRDAKNIWISNPIYQEILPRALSANFQGKLGGRSVDYVKADGSLDMKKLLEKFTQFYRENSAAWMVDELYKESAPHIIMMAFLQRVINGGGTIHREYALGRKRVDLLITWPAGKQRIVVELKVWYSPQTMIEGLQQTAEYMDTSNATEGHLVIFDRRAGRTWDEKIYRRQEKVDHKVIEVWGL
jgi:hypothetical protein